MTNLDKIKEIFKIHIKKLMNRFDDSRIIHFSNKGDESLFPSFELPLDLHHTIGVYWHKNIIQIQYNDKIIEEVYLNKNIDHIDNLIKQIANHEYGHTLQFKSMFYRLPRDTRNDILIKNPKEISKEDLIKCINNSNDRMITEQEKCKNVHYAQIDDIFQDFWANSIVFSKIDKTPPEEMIKNRLDSLIINDCLYPDNIFRKDILYNKRIFELLLYTQEFFFYDRWDNLENLYIERNLGKLLRFYHFMNLFFKRILDSNNNFDNMRDDLIDLTLILDKINYKLVLFENKFKTNDIKVLIEFRDFLKNKKGV